MRWAQQLRMRILMLFHRCSENARLENELQFHLEQQVAENIARGMSLDEARFAALRRFGNPTLLREKTRSTWSWNWMEKVWRDLRYGVRTLRRAPGFSLVAIAVMALGIGATTSLFTIVRSVLLKPLPFRDPDNLVMVYDHFTQFKGEQYLYNTVAPGDYYDWRNQTHGFQDMAAWRWDGGNLTGDHAELPEMVVGAAGTWNMFSLLGIQPVFGRTFTPDEDQPEARQVVLSWSLFQRRFAGDRSIVGRTLRLDSHPYTIIGVLPQWFNYPDPRVQFWVPYASAFPKEQFQSHESHQSYVIARLKSGVSAEAATKEVSTLQYHIHMANPAKAICDEATFRPMIDDVVVKAKTPILVLLGAVGCMLLIACLNVSNLLVARGAARRKEVAIRGALGGSRLTLIREQMTESFIICLLGGALGVLLSFWATQWLAQNWRELPRSSDVHLDSVVVGFSFALICVAALLAGLLPAISSTGKGLLAVLQDSSRAIGGSTSRAGLRRILLTAEIALTVILLVSAGLLFKSFIHLRTADLGCITDNVLTIRYGLPDKQYNKPEMVMSFHEALLGRVRHLPGVLAAGLVSMPPGGGHHGDLVFTIPEHPSQGDVMEQDALVRAADPGYFSAIGIPLLSGRFFTEAERLDRTQYVIINKKLAEQFFRGESPVGKHLSVAWSSKPEPYEIVGVVGDTLERVDRPVRPTIYFPILSGIYDQTSDTAMVIHTSGDPLSLSVPMQKQVAALDPELPVYDVMTMQQIIGRTTATEKFSSTLVLAFAGLSLLLAAVGLYGVLSYLVSQRVTEIGIRMALGAQRSEVLRLILVDAMRPVVTGLLLGSAGAAAAGLLIKSVLYGTRPVEPTVFAAMLVSLLLTATVASTLPALRACRIEPTQALRME
ncbi:MAG TPA: ABC transporter permease [Candidatus Angelobacter sp.]